LKEAGWEVDGRIKGGPGIRAFDGKGNSIIIEKNWVHQDMPAIYSRDLLACFNEWWWYHTVRCALAVGPEDIMRRILIAGAEEGFLWEVPWESKTVIPGGKALIEPALVIEDVAESLHQALDSGFVALYEAEDSRQRELGLAEAHAAVADWRSWDPQKSPHRLTVVLTNTGIAALRAINDPSTARGRQS
jgi:hypothetical protein